MKPPAAHTVLATYRVRKGKEAAFRKLLARHWPVLRRMRLVTADPPTTYEGRDGKGRTFFVEVFTWRSDAAVERAHHAPEVGEVWEAMGPLCEERDGRPQWEFPHVRKARIRHARP
jgi:hypothetical protein